MVSSAQLRAARAYLGWTMIQAAKAAGLHRRTIIRLENDKSYADGQPASLRKLITVYRKHRLILDGNGVALADIDAEQTLLDCSIQSGNAVTPA
jgi:transcriptional regulator with XRE-family HTH domain